MKILTLILSFILMPIAYAGTLSSNNGIEILAVNGEKISSNMFNGKSIDLSDGKHQVVVQYSGNFKKSRGSIESKVHVFFVNMHGDTVISTTKFKRKRQVENAIRNGFVFIVKSNSETIEMKNSDVIKGEGFMPYSKIESLVAKYNATHNTGIAPAVGLVISTSNVAMTKAPHTGATTSADLIKAYNSADKAQRKAFRVWLLEQDMK